MGYLINSESSSWGKTLINDLGKAPTNGRFALSLGALPRITWKKVDRAMHRVATKEMEEVERTTKQKMA